VKKAMADLVLWRRSGLTFARRFRLLNTRHYRWPISVQYRHGLFLVADISSGQQVYIARTRRLVFYHEGVEKRLNMLARQYLLDRLAFEPGDVAIDVGANVGELGMWLRKQSPEITYIALEPSSTEHAASRFNVPGASLLNFGAWNRDTELGFFDRNDSGDSSFFAVSKDETSTRIAVRRLDGLEDVTRHASIKLLKVEAEGGEPEVLEGATGILPRVRFVVADCGFERGSENHATADEVIRLMVASGFTCIGCYPERLILLFRNDHHVVEGDSSAVKCKYNVKSTS
jgi:FkbM family methyltransferase